ncbi:hypothetical protein CYY_006519 [Polysphondylium violaceum]|uniref:Uncharacterized protein n=1 Tax=Polysphondylium violaceum TaxID=133409 RepID=A0A8J4PQ74_9MYCE|nr:hypothetical protein CYY_006519 [Polysphondylium violaceum]
MIFKALSSISSPFKSMKSSSQTSMTSGSSSGNGQNGNSCYYIIAIGGPCIWVADNANPHKYYFGYPPATATTNTIV